MTAYSLFNPLYALATAGLPVAVSKLVSESVARGRCQDAKRVFRLFPVSLPSYGYLGLHRHGAGGKVLLPRRWATLVLPWRWR